MIQGVHKTLKNIEEVIPNYKGQGYEIEGLFGFRDMNKNVPKETYEKHLVNLIKDLRKRIQDT